MRETGARAAVSPNQPPPLGPGNRPLGQTAALIARSADVTSLLVVPVRSRQVIGAIGMTRRCGQPSFEDDHRAHLEALAAALYEPFDALRAR